MRLDLRRLIAFSCLSAFAAVLMLGVVSTAAAQVAKDGVSLMLMVVFLMALLIYGVSLRVVLVNAGVEIEAVVSRFRVDLAEQLRNADSRVLGDIGRGTLFAALTRHTRTISQALSMLVFGAQHGILIVVASLYLAWLAPSAFFVMALFALVAIALHFARLRRIGESRMKAEAAETKVAAGITELLDGAKEIRMNVARADALMADLWADSAEASRARTAAKQGWNGGFVRIQLIFFTLIGFTVFAVPLFSAGYHAVVVQVTTAMLFLIGPISETVQSLSNVDEARAALVRIRDLRRRLREAADAAPDETTGSIASPRREITLDEVTFTYRDAAGRAGFTLGPVSLTLRAGETVFVTGGNGSGKSTLLILLTGLVRPESGRILVDGRPLAVNEYQAYRDSIAVVFYDFHLFQRLYGIGEPDPETAARLLADMEMDGKVAICGDAFTTVALSSGQRKRLALTAAELEDKPVLVLDEWAADQDPMFRRKFYGELLESITGRHRFRVFVTHDDRWFDRADRILQLVDGMVHDVTDDPARWAMR